jgi:hypothetical protein
MTRIAWCLALGSLLAFLVTACGTERPPLSASEVVAVERDALPGDPGDAAWKQMPVHRAGLLLQDMVEPRLLEPSTSVLDIRAATDGERIAFHLSWKDPSANDLPKAGRFPDACAVQLPQGTEPDVPAPQMGESGRTVEITYWRATWQATVDGRRDDIRSLYPAARIDHYPFEAASLEPGSPAQRELAAEYSPARALENKMEGPRERAVEDLIAQGPGTLTRRPETEQRSEGRGRRTSDGWEVVLVRPLPASLATGHRSQVAVAVWNGEHGEIGARKMRSAWIPLQLQEGDER